MSDDDLKKEDFIKALKVLNDELVDLVKRSVEKYERLTGLVVDGIMLERDEKNIVTPRIWFKSKG